MGRNLRRLIGMVLTLCTVLTIFTFFKVDDRAESLTITDFPEEMDIDLGYRPKTVTTYTDLPKVIIPFVVNDYNTQIYYNIPAGLYINLIEADRGVTPNWNEFLEEDDPGMGYFLNPEKQYYFVIATASGTIDSAFYDAQIEVKFTYSIKTEGRYGTTSRTIFENCALNVKYQMAEIDELIPVKFKDTAKTAGQMNVYEFYLYTKQNSYLTFPVDPFYMYHHPDYTKTESVWANGETYFRPGEKDYYDETPVFPDDPRREYEIKYFHKIKVKANVENVVTFNVKEMYGSKYVLVPECENLTKIDRGFEDAKYIIEANIPDGYQIDYWLCENGTKTTGNTLKINSPTGDQWTCYVSKKQTTDPITDEPTDEPTDKPISQAPVSQAPVTQPVTQAPVTQAPVTQAPVTQAPAQVESIDKVRAFVTRLYSLVLNREPDPSGIDFWTDNLYTFKDTGAGVAKLFITSEEFRGRPLSNEQFLDIMYHTFFDRDPDAEGKAYWMDILNNNKLDKLGVAGCFMESREWADTCADFGIRSGVQTASTKVIMPSESTYSFVERIYTIALGRSYDYEGREYWASNLANFNMTGEYVGSFFFMSEEMQGYGLSNEEFLKRLYLTFMDREPDTAGYNYWISVFNGGASRQAVVQGFTRSPEFVQRCIDARIIPFE